MVDFTVVAFGAVLAAGVTLAVIGPPAGRVAAPQPTATLAPGHAPPAPTPTAAITSAPASSAPASSAPASSAPTAPAPVAAAASPAPWVTPDINKLPNDAWGKTVRYGRDLIVRTAALIGPEVADPAHRFDGNNLNCQNCHLEAGTKQFGNPFRGVYSTFPNYRSRAGAVGTIQDRIEGCMTRSMNGKPLPVDGREMTAMVAYMKFLSTGRPVGAPTPGRGSGRMAELTRAADPVHGAAVFAQNCAACHGTDGAGKLVGKLGDAKGYTFPPLWGADSFNDGAGMGRLIAAANFIHSNMPNGVTWQTPALSVPDAWDVAAFVLSHPRPPKAHLARDYPVALQRPADSGYGPYVDGFSQTQHRLGPFAPIRARIKQMLAAPAATNAGAKAP